MKITHTTKYTKAPLFLFVPDKGFTPSHYPKLSDKISKAIKKAWEQKIFTGKSEEILQLTDQETPTYLVGTGDGKDAKELQKSGGVPVRMMQEKKITSIQLVVGEKTELKTLLLGTLLAQYSFKVEKENRKKQPLLKVNVLCKKKLAKDEWTDTQAIASGVNITRNMVNLPANLMMPADIIKQAKSLAKAGKNIKIKVIDEKQAKKLGMGALLAVGQGSKAESALIVLEYTGGKKKEAPTAFVGKGVSFDTGGYNLKPTNGIFDMKMDMGGAATVLGLFDWIGATQPKQNILGVIPTVENMVSSNAYRPGDIITAMNGKTIEIGNTDAEGRLILADALHYTVTKHKPAAMIDLATLTGAVIVALGYEITGVMGNDPKVVKNLLTSAKKANEEMWELPITETFRKAVKNDVSDLKNINGNVRAGSSVAGAFLEQFVGDTPWAHLDIAGTAFSKEATSICPRGATGVMVQTLIEYVKGV